ncbi:MAG: nitroreductase family protein [Candidatus Woesearchaeota archaeon]
MVTRRTEDLAAEERALEKVFMRRTCREYSGKSIPKDNLNLIIEAGRLAPNAGNLQNWRFIIVNAQEQKERLGEASYNQRWIADAHVLIVIASDEMQGERFYDERGSFFNIQNCAMAAENMLIAASILNVDSAFVSGFDEEEVSNILGIPNDFRPQGIVVLGRALRKPMWPGKRELNEIAYVDSFGTKFADMEGLMHDTRIIDKLKKHANLALPTISSEVKESLSQGRFEMLRKELELKNRQIESLKNDLSKKPIEKKVVNIINIEGPWGYYILRRAKGLEYPVSRKDLKERFSGFHMRRIPVEKVMDVIQTPVESHSDLLKKVKIALDSIGHNYSPESDSVLED